MSGADPRFSPQPRDLIEQEGKYSPRHVGVVMAPHRLAAAWFRLLVYWMRRSLGSVTVPGWWSARCVASRR
jgi:hypothetical protein